MLSTIDLFAIADKHGLSATQAMVYAALEFYAHDELGGLVVATQKEVATKARVHAQTIRANYVALCNAGLIENTRDGIRMASTKVEIHPEVEIHHDVVFHPEVEIHPDVEIHPEPDVEIHLGVEIHPDRDVASGDGADRVPDEVANSPESAVAGRENGAIAGLDSDATIGTHACAPIKIYREDLQEDLLDQDLLTKESSLQEDPDLEDLFESLSKDLHVPREYVPLPADLERDLREVYDRALPALEGLSPPVGFTWEQVLDPVYVGGLSADALREKAGAILALGNDHAWACHVVTHRYRAEQVYWADPTEQAPEADLVVARMWSGDVYGCPGDVTKAEKYYLDPEFARVRKEYEASIGAVERKFSGMGPQVYRLYQVHRRDGGRLGIEAFIEQYVMKGEERPQPGNTMGQIIYRNNLEYRRGLLYKSPEGGR